MTYEKTQQALDTLESLATDLEHMGQDEMSLRVRKLQQAVEDGENARVAIETAVRKLVEDCGVDPSVALNALGKVLVQTTHKVMGGKALRAVWVSSRGEVYARMLEDGQTAPAVPTPGVDA